MSEENVTRNDNNDLDRKMITVNQNKFNRIVVPSLQEISMSCIVTTIYKQHDVLEIIQQPGNDEKEKLSEIERNLEQKLIKLPMPSSLMDKALSFCKFVTFQGNHTLGLTKSLTKRYGTCRCGFDFSIPIEYFDCLCFKMDCTVDKLKTFTLISETDYPDYKIFIAASHLCSKELAYKSWEKISLHYIMGSCKLHEVLRHFQDDEYGMYDCRINIYWLYFVNDKLSELCVEMFEGSYPYRVNKNILFDDSLRNGNSVACKYFYQLLDEEELEEYNMERWMDEVIEKNMGFYLTIKSNLDCCDIYFFLLSETNDRKKQIENIRNHNKFLLSVFVLNVSYEKFLEPVMQFIWNSLDKNDFINIFGTILSIVGDGNHRVKSCLKLFKELWNLCSKSGKKPSSADFVRSIDLSMGSGSSNYHLFENEFFDIVKLILSEGPDAGKGDCLYSLTREYKLCSSIIADINYLNEIDNFLGQIILSSKEECSVFKKRVIDSCNYEIILPFIKLDDYDSVNQFIEWALTSESEIEVYKRSSIKKKTLFFGILHDLLYDYEKANKFLNWCFTSQNEVDEYKRDFGFMKDVLRSILGKTDGYEEAQQFVNWCLNSESEIKQFKKDFIESLDGYFVGQHFGDFDAYREYVEWCLEGEQDFKVYKKSISEFKNLCVKVTLDLIALDKFEYANKMIDWCVSQERIKRFKLKVFDSDYNMAMLMCIGKLSLLRENGEMEYPSIQEMAKKLSSWYGPVGLRRIRQLKRFLRRKEREMEEEIEEMEVIELMDEDYSFREQEWFLKLLEELVKSLEADHKST